MGVGGHGEGGGQLAVPHPHPSRPLLGVLAAAATHPGHNDNDDDM